MLPSSISGTEWGRKYGQSSLYHPGAELQSCNSANVQWAQKGDARLLESLEGLTLGQGECAPLEAPVSTFSIWELRWRVWFHIVGRVHCSSLIIFPLGNSMGQKSTCSFFICTAFRMSSMYYGPWSMPNHSHLYLFSPCHQHSLPGFAYVAGNRSGR